MKKLFISLALVILAILICDVEPVWAVQSHGGSEGLVSHQIGHFLFTVGMGYLLSRLYSMSIEGVGWFEFKIFLWLLILWNITTFSGHWINEVVAKDKFVKANGNVLSFEADNVIDILFYLTRLDHLVLVPAFAFLVLALRKWSAQS